MSKRSEPHTQHSTQHTTHTHSTSYNNIQYTAQSSITCSLLCSIPLQAGEHPLEVPDLPLQLAPLLLHSDHVALWVQLQLLTVHQGVNCKRERGEDMNMKGRTKQRQM